MKKCLSMLLMLVLFMLCPLYAIAESDAPLLAEDGWSYIGYSYGGITFAVPADFVNYDLSASDTANGYILIGGNDEFVLQMRVFQADELTYDEFKAMVEKTPSAESSVRADGDSEILTYRNTQPSASNELYGIAMTGLDGLFYKISIFTGTDEAYGEDAPVWQIAETVGQTARHQDFSDWDIEGAPQSDLSSSISDFLNRLIQG